LFLLSTEHIGLSPVLKPLLLKKISSYAPDGKSGILKISAWKLYEYPSLPAEKFIQLVTLSKYYNPLKSG
jgi:hypothetical protein